MPNATPFIELLSATWFVIVLLCIEFLMSSSSCAEAAWPLIRDDFALSYAQIGLLLAVPGWSAPWSSRSWACWPMCGGGAP